MSTSCWSYVSFK